MIKTKILMVCLGNICRSPLAEGILKAKVDFDEVIVDSAGTGDYHIGEAPDERSIEIAKKNDLDISEQRARQFSAADFKAFDYIFVMDNSNYDNVIRLAESDDDRSKVKLILNELYPDENRNVPDPYLGGKEGFRKVYELLDRSASRIVDDLL